MLCSHGAVLFYIARYPGCTINDIAGALVLARKTAWRLVRDLRRSGLIQARREGRRHRHWVEGEGRLPDPVLSHLSLHQIVSALTA
jgi:predicted transcriptional regulator